MPWWFARHLSLAIAQDPDLEVAGTAVNGRVALAKFPALKPDIVLLDFEMPEMDGLETVRELRKIDPRVPIIMFSSLTEHGASVTLEALSLGATDYVTKPSNVDMDGHARSHLARTHPEDSGSLPTARTATQLALPRSTRNRAKLHSPILALRCRDCYPRVQMVAIGVSTGGPDALARVLPSLPADFPVPIVIAQHMPPIFTSLLAARLSAKSALPVRECVSGKPLTPGCVVIAPGDFHMVVSQQDGLPVLKTHQGPKENFCRPSVDVLFHSVARLYGAAPWPWF